MFLTKNIVNVKNAIKTKNYILNTIVDGDKEYEDAAELSLIFKL